MDYAFCRYQLIYYCRMFGVVSKLCQLLRQVGVFRFVGCALLCFEGRWWGSYDIDLYSDIQRSATFSWSLEVNPKWCTFVYNGWWNVEVSLLFQDFWGKSRLFCVKAIDIGIHQAHLRRDLQTLLCRTSALSRLPQPSFSAVAARWGLWSHGARVGAQDDRLHHQRLQAGVDCQ